MDEPVRAVTRRPLGRAAAVASGALATVLVGVSVPVTGLLAQYPLLSGQAIRYAIGALALYVWLRGSGRRLRRPSRRDLLGLAGMIGAGMLGFNAAQLTAQRYAEPGFVAAVLGGGPLILALLAPALRGRRPALGVVLGALVVVFGVVVLSGGGSWHGPGLLLSILTLLGEVTFTLSGAGVTERLGIVETCVLACGAAAVIGAVLSTVSAGPAAWPIPTVTQIVALLVLGVLVTAVAFCCWYVCVSAVGADRAGILSGLMPLSGLVTSVLLNAQTLTVLSIVGALLVGAGCAIGLRGKT
ncbi:MAG TPA: EamA family transporter [Pseudonocardiaceae bacterium]|jgi:drug/metabolite transporter (DMT)-like permease|nr:EamA family transporter [Pseudonocardiaceae bacterium]